MYLRRAQIPKAMVIPDLPFDEYQFCLFERWRTGEIVYTVFSLIYGKSFSVVRYPYHNS